MDRNHAIRTYFLCIEVLKVSNCTISKCIWMKYVGQMNGVLINISIDKMNNLKYKYELLIYTPAVIVSGTDENV